MLRSIGVILFSIFFSSSPLDGHRLDVEGTMDWKPENQSAYVRFQEVDDLEQIWNVFKTEHGKTYKDSSEEEDRKKIFEENLKEIALHNERYAKGEETYEQGMNQFGDMTNSEFVKLITVRPTGNRTKVVRNNTIPDELRKRCCPPDAFDWRTTGAVTRVKNQGYCGSGWAFGATGALEGAMYLKSKMGIMVPLSEQNLVDCSYWNHGCYGGYPWEAYINIKYHIGGIDSEDSYQYEAQRGTCRYNPRTKAAHVLWLIYLCCGREDILQRAVAYLGPISVLVDASGMQFYRSGIYSNGSCRRRWWQLNHSALVVGYKSAGPGRDYWIVKNSWGTSWGMDGYILMTRNKGNQCGIASEAVFPIV